MAVQDKGQSMVQQGKISFLSLVISLLIGTDIMAQSNIARDILTKRNVIDSTILPDNSRLFLVFIGDAKAKQHFGYTRKDTDNYNYLMQLDAKDSVLWFKNLEGSKFELYEQLHCDAFGNFYITGYMQDFLSVTRATPSQRAFFIIKFTRQKEEAWAAFIEDFIPQRYYELHVDGNGELFLFGFYAVFNHPTLLTRQVFPNRFPYVRN